MNGSSDVADDMCVWLHPTDRSKSIIFGNNKTDDDDPEGGIYCYALDGGPTDTLSPDTLGWGAGNWFDQGKKVNNVDVRYNFQAGSEQWDLVVGGNRTDERIDIFRVDTDAGGDFTGLTQVGSIQTDSNWIPSGNNIGNDSPYGLAMFHSKSQNKLYAIASSKGGRVAQWEMSYNAGTELIDPFIEGTRVWMTPLVAFGGASDFNELVEGIVADDEKDVVYIAGEDTSIYRYQTPKRRHSGRRASYGGQRDCPGRVEPDGRHRRPDDVLRLGRRGLPHRVQPGQQSVCCLRAGILGHRRQRLHQELLDRWQRPHRRYRRGQRQSGRFVHRRYVPRPQRWRIALEHQARLLGGRRQRDRAAPVDRHQLGPATGRV